MQQPSKSDGTADLKRTFLLQITAPGSEQRRVPMKSYSTYGNPIRATTTRMLVFASVLICVSSFEVAILLAESSKPYVHQNDVSVNRPQVYNGNDSSSNLTLKIDAVKQDVDKLIKALTDLKRDPSNQIYGILSGSSTGNITRPSLNDKVARLENEMAKMKEDIQKLLASSVIGSKEKERLAALESSVEALQTLFDDLRLEFQHKISTLESLVEYLIGSINDLRTELDVLKRKTEREQEASRLQRLPAECIASIKSHDFATAAQKLQEINDDVKINLIINEVYGHHESNFDLVLKFGESLAVKERSFLVFKALNYEMESNGHRDPLKRVKLIDSLRKGIIDQRSTSSQLNKQAKSFEGDLKNSIKVVAKERLRNGMLNNAYVSNAEITTLSNEIYRIDDRLFADLLTEVVNEVYWRMDKKQILICIKSHSFLQQSIPGYSAVLNRLRNTNDDALITIAYYIKEAMDSRGYTNLDSANKATLNQMKDSLPRSVRNLAFASKVCIENVKYPKYLYASGRFLHDNPRRHVFTWRPGNTDVRHQEDHWKFIRTGDSFYIYNVAHREYMYSPSEYKDFKIGKDRRKVFTWTQGGAFDSCKWNLELTGQNVFIKSGVRSEYLYTSNTYLYFPFTSIQRMFTWIPGGRVGNGVWSIVDCSNA